MQQKQLSWLVRSLFLVPVLPAAHAQQAAPAPAAEPTIQQVTVTGIRASVRSALAVKENSNSIVEVVASEDIGKLPDTTIAESLARLPGLGAGLDRGNASQIIARGMGPRFIGATLNGRELASSEPNRAVRFEQFPSESLSGAIVYKTQNADLVEGGVATTVDLQTVSPLKYSGRQASLKADALYYALAKDVDAQALRPRLGGIYIDQLANKTVGVALAFSYQKQPSIEKRKKLWGFNMTNSVDINRDGSVDRMPWGFEAEVKRGTNERASVLGKVEWKASADALITADLYYAKNKINEPAMSHWSGDVGNWDGWQSNAGMITSPDIRNGYVVGATVSGVGLTTNSTQWIQDMDNLAGGLNGKFNVGEWKVEADLAMSKAGRDSQWRDVRQFANNPATIKWSFTGDERQDFTFGHDTGNPAAFGNPTLHVDNDGHVEDRLDSAQVNAWRPVDFGAINRIKFGARIADREKSYRQTSWNLPLNAPIPASAYETVRVDGFAPFIVLKDFGGTTGSLWGGNAYNPAGRPQQSWDLLAGWKVKERSSSVFAQADLEGEMFGKSYRGNAGVRVVHTEQTGSGMQSINGAAPTPAEGGTSYTRYLPSFNLIFNMDEGQNHQLRFSMARAMARAPLDQMRASRQLSMDTNPTSQQPITGSAGNPLLLPMMSNQADLAWQWYFAKGSLVSAGLFYKQIGTYIGVTTDTSTLNGRQAILSRSINGEGGNVRGLELVFNHAFTQLPAPFDGLGVSANYTYSDSDIKEFTNNFPMDGLMKHNGGITVWYEKNGYEARLSANYHSDYVRMPEWSPLLIQNPSETYVTASFSKWLTPQLQLRVGLDNITNQKVVHTYDNNPYYQNVMEYGRRYNVGLSYKF
jgi:TonB-dependent receptor